MGLCKCPQRKITNIFCYEHRVNVCEHCLMQNHPKCVVDTYRNWITDSVYSSKCILCDTELAEGETVRLMCLHILHWKCLDKWARSLPATTASAGYVCPCCKKMCLFPMQNQISPIADVLRLQMGEVNWARAGLGLPLIQEDENGTADSFEEERLVSMNHTVSEGYTSAGSPIQPQYLRHSTNDVSYTVVNNPASMSITYGTKNQPLNPGDASSKDYTSKTSSRKFGRNDTEMPLLIDEDDNKYRRRPPLESLARWLKNFAPIRRRPTKKKYAIMVLIALVFVIFLLLSFARRDFDDDAFNPKNNPNVLIGDGPPVKFDFN